MFPLPPGRLQKKKKKKHAANNRNNDGSLVQSAAVLRKTIGEVILVLILPFKSQRCTKCAVTCIAIVEDHGGINLYRQQDVKSD